MNSPYEPDDPSTPSSNTGEEPHLEHADSAPTSPGASDSDESTGDAALDARLSSPVFEGYRGIETAQFVMSAFLVGVVALLSYSNSLGGEFIGRDRAQILENEALHHLGMVPDSVSSANPGPLGIGALSLNWLVTPASAAGFQAVNIAIHILNAVLLFAVARTLLRSRTNDAVCMTAGLLLAVLPAATMTVNYFVGRGALLATFFTCSALLLAYRATQDPARVRPGAMALSVVCQVAAMGCAAQAVMLPLVVIGYVWTVRGIEHMRSFLPWIGGLILLQCANGIALASLLWPSPGRLIAAPSFMFSAVIDAVIPVRLSVSHGLPFFSYVMTFFVLLFMGSFTLALLVLRRRAGVALLWFGLCVLATAVVTPPGNLLAGRHEYLPVAGLLLLVPWMLTRIPAGAPRAAAGIFVAVLTLTAGWITLERNAVWNDPVALWTEASEIYPEAFEPKQELGRIFVLEGQGMAMAAAQVVDADQAAALRTEAESRFNAAVELLESAVDLGDPHAQTHVLAAEAYVRLGKGAEAEESLLAALAVDSTHYEATIELASMLEAQATAQNDPAAAARGVAYYERAHALSPLSPERLARYGMLLASVGRFDDAASVLSEAVAARQPSPYAEALHEVQEKLKQVRDLEQFSADQMRLNPGGPAGLRARAQSQLIRGEYLDASYVLERLIKQYPDDYGTWMLLGLTRAKMDGAERFVAQHGAAPSPPESGVLPWQDLAERSAGMGSLSAAVVYLSQATEVPVLERSLLEGRWALAQGNYEPVQGAIDAAKEAAGDDARPWLLEADLALATGRTDAAELALREAKERGAAAEEIELRSQRMRGTAAAVGGAGSGASG